jgi:hypothetical protein
VCSAVKIPEEKSNAKEDIPWQCHAVGRLWEENTEPFVSVNCGEKFKNGPTTRGGRFPRYSVLCSAVYTVKNRRRFPQGKNNKKEGSSFPCVRTVHGSGLLVQCQVISGFPCHANPAMVRVREYEYLYSFWYSYGKELPGGGLRLRM